MMGIVNGRAPQQNGTGLPPHPDPDRLDPEREESLAAETDPQASGDILPAIQRSQEAFRRDLPRLLQVKKRYRQWVAYRGDERVGFGRTAIDLYQECRRRGLTEQEFVVRCILPEMSEETDATPLFEV